MTPYDLLSACILKKIKIGALLNAWLFFDNLALYVMGSIGK